MVFLYIFLGGEIDMNFVEPVKDLDTLENMCRYLKENNPRDYILFYLGIYTGLRISDILKFKIRDLKGKNQIKLRETKTGKEKFIPINPVLKKELEKYFENKDPDDFIIKSRQGYNKPISRTRAYYILDKLGKRFNINNLATHSMRKTFGYHYYNKTKDIALLQIIFNHSSPSVTLRYIGIEQDDIDNAYKKLRYF